MARIRKNQLKSVRFVFADQRGIGIVRGKSVVANKADAALRNGLHVPSSIRLKDTSHRTVFPVWTRDADVGEGAMIGARNALLVPDAASYVACRSLTALGLGALLCGAIEWQFHFICIAYSIKKSLQELHARGRDMRFGLGLALHVFRVG